MSREKVIMTAAAGAGLIGATIYATRKNRAEAPDHRNMAQQKYDLGLSGAGIGGNRVAGAMERGGSHGRGDGDPGRQITTAESRDKLPSGKIGAGEGAGGSGARRTEIPFSGSSSNGTSRGDQTGRNQASYPHGQSVRHLELTPRLYQNDTKAQMEKTSPESSGWVNSVKSAVSGKRNASRKDEEGLHDTRGISKMGPETPSKRGPADASD
ncbi:uncharacterized protein MAM_04541 [Metarhizium album ARSEF 1941]|uniref:Uncharacterized protein n=1 Tax=Metarhizium album (strain ARSEF 1941) TaxID=1081103 RepID=A0A0B2WN88_METAS|nr:uncharacterized protein MAM_04541 [Metarhizium album ARSEF 1941]KHN97526.1 hypothetical protein MAM_04541 [Metarhizium album ARSEF 1941]